MQQFLQFITRHLFTAQHLWGAPHAHHQELNNCSSSLWFYLRSVVTALLLVVVGPVGPTTTNNFSSLLLDVYLQLNIFGVPPHPSSGAQQLQ